MLKLPPSFLLLFLLVDLGLVESLQTTAKLQVDEPLEITLTVTDKHGNPIQGLKQEYFQVFIDKIEQKIERLSQADEPFSIGIVVDASGSIQQTLKMQQLAEGISRFQALSNKRNEYFLNVTDPPRELKGLSARAREGFYLHRPAKEKK